jgi:SPP1 family phage portal protein
MTFIHESDELTAEELLEFIKLHQAKVPRYRELKKQYESKPPILYLPDKDPWKPDNRLVVNFAKYLVDTFNGYFSGIPVKVAHDIETVNDAVNDFWNLNDLDDTLSELSKLTSMYGVGFLYVWQDEDARTKVTYNDPLDMFVIYDDTIEQKPKYAVRYKLNKDDQIEGTLITLNEYIEFAEGKKGLTFADAQAHYYPTLPVIEFVENEEHQSLIEPVESLINAYNKAVSEKANDVDYFSDAYLKILGAELDEEGTYKIRDNRIINLFGTDDASKIIVDFLSKPDGDTSQENLLDRIERLIYQTSMIANINDESFGNASGVSLEFKLQPMKNLAAMKERKFTRGLNTLFKLFLSLPTNVPAAYADEWTNVHYRFTRNIPRNIPDEAKTARELDGIVSDETKLSVLSIVDNVQDEMDRIEAERELPQYDMDRSAE